MTCHVAGGVSGSTRLVFVPDTVADHEAENRQAFEAFLSDVDGGADLILSKAQGVLHGGGQQLTAGSEDFASLERFLGRLDQGEAFSHGGHAGDAVRSGAHDAGPHDPAPRGFDLCGQVADRCRIYRCPPRWGRPPHHGPRDDDGAGIPRVPDPGVPTTGC